MRISYWSSDVCSSDLKYSPDDGRLMERYARRTDQVLQDLFYSYDPMGNVLSLEDQTLPVRYFANQRVEPASRSRYDSTYPVTEATGPPDARRVGKERVRPCNSRWSPYHYERNHKLHNKEYVYQEQKHTIIVL